MRTTLAPLLLAAGLVSMRCAGDEPARASGATLVTWAGEGAQGYNGEGRERAAAWLNQPVELSFAGDAAIVTDWNNHMVRRIAADGRLERLIGLDLPGDWPCQNPSDAENCALPLDAAIAGEALALNHPTDVIARGDHLLVAAWHNHKLYRYDLARREVTIVIGAQAPGLAGDGGPAAQGRCFFPDALAADAEGNVFFSDQKNNRVRRIDAASGAVTTVAGASTPATAAGLAGDGGPAAQAVLALAPYDDAGGVDNPPPGGGLAFAADGALFVADTYNHCIRRIAAGSDGLVGSGAAGEEIVEVVAGSCGRASHGYSGDGGPAASALLWAPHDLELGPDGALYVADTLNHVVRRIDLEAGTIDTVVGTGTPGFSGDGGPPRAAELNRPLGIAFDAVGALYVVDTLNNRIRKVEP